MAQATRRSYLLIFLVLALLTALEVGVTYSGMNKRAMIWLLISMAVSKAALVALFFMHLKSETRGLRLSVLIPISLPALYALILVAETSWRLVP